MGLVVEMILNMRNEKTRSELIKPHSNAVRCVVSYTAWKPRQREVLQLEYTRGFVVEPGSESRLLIFDNVFHPT